MNATPTDDEAAAIAAALLRYTAPRPQPRAIADSSWGAIARREGVSSNVPRMWRG